jgi:hypothetical protein
MTRLTRRQQEEAELAAFRQAVLEAGGTTLGEIGAQTLAGWLATAVDAVNEGDDHQALMARLGRLNMSREMTRLQVCSALVMAARVIATHPNASEIPALLRAAR